MHYSIRVAFTVFDPLIDLICGVLPDLFFCPANKGSQSNSPFHVQDYSFCTDALAGGFFSFEAVHFDEDDEIGYEDDRTGGTTGDPVCAMSAGCTIDDCNGGTSEDIADGADIPDDKCCKAAAGCDIQYPVIDAVDPWASDPLMEALADAYADDDPATPTDDEVTAALYVACGGRNQTNGANPGYKASWDPEDWEDQDISCADTRIQTVAHGGVVPEDFSESGNPICKTSGGCPVNDCAAGSVTTIDFDAEITEGTCCENFVDNGDGTTTDLDCDIEYTFQGYYICHNPVSRKGYPRTECQANDELPPSMSSKGFAACGWCCQTMVEDENKHDEEECGGSGDVDCDLDDDGTNDGFLMDVTNGANWNKEGNIPTGVEQCIAPEDVKHKLDQFWGTECA